MNGDEQVCPLCSAPNCNVIAQKRFKWGDRSWRHCAVCDFVFVPKSQHPSHEEERAEYELHENSLDDPGYRSFLERFTKPFISYIKAGARGLDFGCGPTPALAEMLRKEGFVVEGWDPIFAPDESIGKDRYDFVTCTEVVEHFQEPVREWTRLKSLVKPSGVIGVMTSLRDDGTRFLDWPYIRERSHVSFYSTLTMDWIALHWNFQILYSCQKVIVLRSL